MPKLPKLSHKQNTPPPRRAKKRAITLSKRTPSSRPMNGKHKVTPTLLKEMTRRLVKEFDPEQVILFGSRAWGKPSPSSDVDLMIIVSASNQSDYKRILRAYIALGDLIVPTDIFVKTRAEFNFFAKVPASLENAIVRKGKVLYARSKTTTGAKLAHESAA